MTMGLGTSCNAVYGIVLNLPDDDFGALYRGQDNWSPRMRGAQTVRGGLYPELWPRSGMSPDNSVMNGNGFDENVLYEPWSHGDGGKRGSYFVKGQVLDNASAPVGGATVMVFRTSDNLYIASAGSDSNGNYMCPTPYPGVSHFIVAYIASAPDKAGTTVTNLTPTAS